MKDIYLGSFEKITDIRFLEEYARDGVPADRRLASARLYELGERDLAIEMLIREMNRWKEYKDPDRAYTVRFESCAHAAMTLGSFRDEGAIDPLFEVLVDLEYEAAYGLALIGGERVTRDLRRLASHDNPARVFALFGLGYMGLDECVEPLLNILEAWTGDRRDADYRITRLVGSLQSKSGMRYFLRELDEKWIEILLGHYVQVQARPGIARYAIPYYVPGHSLVLKYGWDKYLSTPEDREAFDYGIPPEEDAERTKRIVKRRKEIAELVLRDAKRRLQELESEEWTSK